MYFNGVEDGWSYILEFFEIWCVSFSITLQHHLSASILNVLIKVVKAAMMAEILVDRF